MTPFDQLRGFVSQRLSWANEGYCMVVWWGEEITQSYQHITRSDELNGG